MESDYYMVLFNPEKHRKRWNELKLMLTIAEANYVVFYDHEINLIQLHQLSKDEFNTYNYSLN